VHGKIAEYKMNYPATSCGVSKNRTHPLFPSLEREGKPSDARRGELKSKQSYEEFYPCD
jgi:hypothetical protein